MTMINLGKIIILVIFGTFLSGCMENSKMKEVLQKEYDSRNVSGNRAFCYYIGNVTYPYLAKPVTYYSGGVRGDSRNEYATKRINFLLQAFESMGLLTSKPRTDENGNTYPFYDLTEEGEKYSWSMQRNWGGGTIANEQHFCFGRRIIESVTSIEDKTTYDNGLRRVETVVYFKYRLENVPEWVLYPIMKKSYGDITDEMSSDASTIYDDQVWLTKKNGQYYNSSSGVTIGMRRIGFYL